MASIQKYSDETTIYRILKHNNRSLEYHSLSNPDIIPELTEGNYSFIPEREAWGRYKLRIDQVYVYKRKPGKNAVNTMAEFVCSLPVEIDPDDVVKQHEFFQLVHNFLTERYGGQNGENVISSRVHVDEGIRSEPEPIYSRFDPQEIIGYTEPKLIYGKPHMHFDFIPCVKIDLAKELSKKRHDPNIEQFTEKVCASKVLSKFEYDTVHKKLQEYLHKHGMIVTVYSGITKQQGGNIPVTTLKGRYRELEAENRRLRDIERKYNRIIKMHPELADFEREYNNRGRF
jgi:hypothetical protein